MAKGGGGEGALGNREKPLLEYIERRQATILEWVDLQAVFDVCAKETGFDSEGRSCKKRWLQTAV